MPPPLLYDLNKVALDKIIIPLEEIRKYNPQRYEMEHLDGIIHMDHDEGVCIAVKHVKLDEFWVRGHIPDRPLLPGVIMIEAAAQACAFYYKLIMGEEMMDKFVGFGGVDNVKFRGTVKPGDTIYFIAKKLFIKSRQSKFTTQGIVNNKIVVQADIIGMPM